MAPNIDILFFCTVFAFVCGPCSSIEIRILDEFQKCKFGPDFDECCCDALNNILPNLRIGDDELGIPPLEPLSLPDMFFKPTQLRLGSLQISQEWQNNVFHNLTKSTFTKVHLDMENSKISFEIFNPQIVLAGTYTDNGTVLQIPFIGSGAYSHTYDNWNIKFTTSFEKVNRDGDIYWHFIKSWGHFSMDKFTLLSESMIDGQKKLSNQVVAINVNWRASLKDLKKPLDSLTVEGMTRILNKEFAKLPIHKVFGSY